MTRRPVLIDLDGQDMARPDTAPAVPDEAQGAAMQHLAAVASRAPSPLARWFWGLALLLTGFVVSLAAWDYVTGLLARAPVLGWIATVLMGLLLRARCAGRQRPERRAAGDQRAGKALCWA
jgi:putative membrane protein